MTNLFYSRFNEYLSYDPETGIVTWKKNKGKSKAGTRAGGLNISIGYRYLMFDKLNYLEHRIIWLLTTGDWPKQEIDHINRVRDDNRLCNLREATRLENSLNSPCRRLNTVHGVHWSKQNNKYKVVFRVNGIDRYFGYFYNYDEACKAAEQAKQKLGIDYANN